MNPDGVIVDNSHEKELFVVISCLIWSFCLLMTSWQERQLQSKHSPFSSGTLGASSLSQHLSIWPWLTKAAVEHVTPTKKKTARKSASGIVYLRITGIIDNVINLKSSLKSIYVSNDCEAELIPARQACRQVTYPRVISFQYKKQLTRHKWLILGFYNFSH